MPRRELFAPKRLAYCSLGTAVRIKQSLHIGQFIERAAAVKSDFAVTRENARAVGPKEESV